jgi:RHS repeat-associated protein
MDRETLITGPDRKVDPDGERTKLEYDEAGRVSRITEPKGVDSESVANDFTTVLEYDDLDRVIRRIQHNVEGGTLKESKRTHYCYEALTGDLKWLVAPKANATSVSCTGTTTPRYAQRYSYDEAHQLLSRTDAGHGTGGATKHAISRTYDANGNVRTTTDERGTVTETKYNGRDLPIEKIELLDKVAGRKLVTRIDYDDAGNRTKVITPRAVDAGSTTEFVTEMVYDKVNRPTRVDLPKSGTEARLFIHKRYDANGNLTATSLPVAATDGGDSLLNLIDARNKTTYSHFDTGWVKTENQPGTPRVRFAYTPEGWQRSRVPETDAGVERWDRQTTWEYWTDGMLRAKKERDGGAITYEYDANNQLTLAHDASGVDDSASDPVDISVSYDGLGRQTEVRQQKVNADRWTATRFTEYSLDDELIERIDNRRETTAGAMLDRGRRQRYSYDDAGWLVQQTDFGTKDAAEADAHADDRQISTDYFATGWEQQRTIAKRPEGSAATAGFTAVKQRTTWDYFDNSKLKALRTRNGSDALLESHDVTYTDPQGRYVNGNRTKDVFTLKGPKASADCRDTATPCTTQYSYDARDRLTEEKRTRGGSDKTTKYTLLPTGDVDVETRADGTTIDNDYVGQQLQRRTVSLAGDSLIQKYNHNLDGNVECVWEAASAGEERTCASAESAGKLLEKYDYDPLDRVRKALRFKPRGGGKDDETTYKYDALDRVVEEDEKHGAAGTDEDRTTTFSYLGTTKDSVEESLKYTHGSKSGQVRRKTFSYDAFGDRIAMTDKPAGSSQEKEYSYGNDVHGSVSLLIDDAGQAKAQYGYTAYGEKDTELTEELDPAKELDPSATDKRAKDEDPVNPYRFSQKRYDSGSETLDMGARRFGPSAGRFLQQDFLDDALGNLGLATDPLSQNRYSLAAGNPISFVETDGHMVALDGGGGSAPARRRTTSRSSSGSGSGSTSSGGSSSRAAGTVFTGGVMMNNWLTRGVAREGFWDAVQGDEMRKGTVVDRSAAAFEGFVGFKPPWGDRNTTGYQLNKDAFEGLSYLSGVGAVRKVGKEGIEEVAEHKADDVIRGAHAGTNVLGHFGPDAQKAVLRAWQKEDSSIAVIGRGPDTAIAKDWPGHQVLSLPRGQWSPAVNDGWVAGHIANHRKVYVASPTKGNMRQTSGDYVGEPTVFARELRQFQEAGYTRQGDWMIPPP